MSVALADTSLFVALERDRPLAVAPTEDLEVSVITVAELRWGVLAAADDDTRAQRLRTLRQVETVQSWPVDDHVAGEWASLVNRLRTARRRMPINDSWIAATALAHRVPIVTQDADYDDVPGLEVIRI